MLLLNWPATLVAIAFIAGHYSFLKRRRYQTERGDVRHGFWFAVTRLGLLNLKSTTAHVRNWRPVLLVLAGNPKTRLRLVEFAHWIEARRGLLFLAQIVTGDWQKLVPMQQKLQTSLTTFIEENPLSAVGQSIMADDFEHGVATLLQASGVGPFQPNTVLTGWSEDVVKQRTFTEAVKRTRELQKNLVVYAEADLPGSELNFVIDVWWHAKENGSFMLTLAHLLRGANPWRSHTLRVLRIITGEAGRQQTEEAMRKLLSDAWITGTPEIIVSHQPPLETIGEVSIMSEICFVGLSVQAMDTRENPLEPYAKLIEKVRGNVFLTKSWHDLEL